MVWNVTTTMSFKSLDICIRRLRGQIFKVIQDKMAHRKWAVFKSMTPNTIRTRSDGRSSSKQWEAVMTCVLVTRVPEQKCKDATNGNSWLSALTNLDPFSDSTLGVTVLKNNQFLSINSIESLCPFAVAHSVKIIPFLQNNKCWTIK